MKTTFPIADAMPVAQDIAALLQPYCERIQIVGSLRRLKPQVGDIELLFIPKTAKERDGLFDYIDVDLAEMQIDKMLADGVLAKRQNVDGLCSWGKKNRFAVHVASGIPVDLFATTDFNWWVSLVIRTGSKDTNLKLTEGAMRQGATLNAYGSGITWSDETKTRAVSERHVFDLCNVPFALPEKR